jgi:hypothetical protein
MSRYPKLHSRIDVIFVDGEVKKFTMTASSGIANHLMQEAAKTGVLIFRDDIDKKSVCIPLAQIRHVEIQSFDPEEVIEDNTP